MRKNTIVLSLLLCAVSISLFGEILSKEEQQWRFVEKKLVSSVSTWSYAAVPVKFATAFSAVFLIVMLGTEYEAALMRRLGRNVVSWCVMGSATMSGLTSYKVADSMTDNFLHRVVVGTFFNKWKSKNRKQTPVELREFLDQEYVSYSKGSVKYFLSGKPGRVIRLVKAAIVLHEEAIR